MIDKTSESEGMAYQILGTKIFENNNKNMTNNDKSRLEGLFKAFLSSAQPSVNSIDFKAKLEAITDIFEKYLQYNK